MKDLGLITDKEAIDLGNMAFRVFKNGRWNAYRSTKWKLHIFSDKDGKTKKVAIVDEDRPLNHIDELWYEAERAKLVYDTSVHDSIPHPQYNFIEITENMVVRHYTRTSINKLLCEESQYFILVWLEQNGYMGKNAVLW